MIHHGDCVEVMAAMDAESIDAIVTDPPYGLEFMGKEWDSFRSDDPGTKRHRGSRAGRHGQTGTTERYGSEGRTIPSNRLSYGIGYRPTTFRCPECGKRDQFRNAHRCGEVEWVKELIDPHAPPPSSVALQNWTHRWATEALRVAKPGAYLLAFGGTRTVHRLTVALEDAGWIIRDVLVWAYAQGFPKSKSSLKPAWEPIVLARKPGPLAPLNIDECRIGTDDIVVKGGGGTYYEGQKSPLPMREVNEQRVGRWPANVILTDPIFDHGSESVRLSTEALLAARLGGAPQPVVTYGDTGTYSRFFLLPKASRKDREPTVYLTCDCETVKLGEWESEAPSPSAPTDSTSPLRAISGATSTDDSGSPTSLSGNGTSGQSHQDTRSTTSTATSKTTGSRTSNSSTPSPTSGSIPAANSSTANGGSGAPSASYSDPSTMSGGTSLPKAGRSTGDADPAISARSSSPSVCADCGLPLPDREGGGAGRRGRVNVHPTQAVKPTRLMRHLIRLVTPEGGTVLDPFLGSGTTAKAAVLEGVEWVGIEREPEYIRIAEQRLVGLEPEPTQLEMTG